MAKIFCSSRLLIFLLLFGIHTYGKIHTLDELIEESIKSSKELQSIKKEMEEIQIRIEEIFGSALPVITASADFDHALQKFIPYTIVKEEEQLGELGLKASGKKIAENNLLLNSFWQPPSDFEYSLSIPGNSFTTFLSIKQPIFLQGKTIIRMRIARARQSQLVCKYDEVRDMVKCRTIKLFYGVLLEQQRLEIVKTRRALAEEMHRLTKVDYLYGRSRELDTLNSLLRLQQIELEAKKAEADRRSSAEAMIVQCGLIESPDNFWVDGEFPEPVFFMTLDEAIVQLGKGNHIIKQFRGDEAVSKELRHLAISDLLPVVFCGATIGRIGQFPYNNNGERIRWNDDQRLFIGAYLELFSGLTRQNTIRRLKVEHEQMLLLQQKTIDELELQTRTKFEQIRLTMDRLSSIRRIMEVASKSYSIAKKAFEIGSATRLELENAEVELNRANLLYNETLYEFHCRLTDFKYLIGKL